MKYIFTILIILFFSFSNAQQINFSKENLASLSGYLKEQNVNFDIKDLATLKNINAFSFYNSNELLVVPEAYFFNREGFRVKGYNGISCDQVIRDLEKINKKRVDKSDTITKWKEHISFFENNDEELINSGYDFFVIINWAKYLPKENKVSFNWYNSIKAENPYKIKIIFLNLDVQENWIINETQKKVLGLD